MLSTVDSRTAGTPGDRAVRRRRRMVLVALLVLGWAAHVAWRIWLARHQTMPIAHTDEDSYLNTARVLAGGPTGFSGENWLMRRVGYPLLISPAFLVTQEFLTTYRAVHVINACLNAAALPPAYLLCRRLLDLSRTYSYVAAFVAVGLPAIAWYSGLAMTDALLAPLTLAWLLALHQWLAAPARVGWAVAAGAAVGASYTMHVRGFVVVGVNLLVVAVLVHRRRLPRRSVLFHTAAVALLGLVTHVADLVIIGDRMRLAGRSPGGQTIGALLSATGAAQFSYSVISQLWYLLVVTLGLGGIAWGWAARSLRRRETSTAARYTYAAALLVTLGVAAGAAVILAGVPLRSSGALYARYIHMTVPFWFLVGIAALIRLTARDLARYTAYTVGLLLAGGVLVTLRVWWSGRDGIPLGYGIFGAPDMMALSNSFGRPRPLVATAVATAGVLLVVAVTRFTRARLPVLAALLAVNVVCLHQVTERAVRPLAAEIIPQPTLASLGVEPGDRVVALKGFDWRIRFDLIHQVTWADVPLMDTVPADADAVLAPWQPGSNQNWTGAASGLRFAGGNKSQAWAVWLRP
jgi:hypothetical protein